MSNDIFDILIIIKLQKILLYLDLNNNIQAFYH